MLFGGETAQSYYEEGITAAMRGDHEQALRYFRRALELDAHLYSAYHQIGRSLLKMGDAANAMPNLQKAVKYSAATTGLHVDMGFTLIHLKEIEAARRVFGDILLEKPKEMRAILGLAYCAFHLQQWETCVGLVQNALILGRAQFDAHLLLARAADRSGALELSSAHYQKALESMHQYIEANSKQAPGYYLRGLVLYGMGNCAAAIEDFNKALEYSSVNSRYCAYNEVFSYVDMLAMKGLCLEGINRFGAAREIGREIVNLVPDHGIGQRLAGLDG